MKAQITAFVRVRRIKSPKARFFNKWCASSSITMQELKDVIGRGEPVILNIGFERRSLKVVYVNARKGPASPKLPFWRTFPFRILPTKPRASRSFRRSSVSNTACLFVLGRRLWRRIQDAYGPGKRISSPKKFLRRGAVGKIRTLGRAS